MTENKPKTCAILMNMGGPDSTADIKQFLKNIFSDRAIIKLPGGKLFQKILASIIIFFRIGKVKENYELIGGGSPLLKWCLKQAQQVEDKLGGQMPEFKCYVGMRYFKPYLPDAIKEAYKDGYRKIIFVPFYPQYSTATTGSTMNFAKDELANYSDIESVFINDYHDNDKYIALLHKYIFSDIQDDETLLFSAHSLPQEFVDNGDPYVDQINKTAKLAAGDRNYHVSFQSRTGPVKWVGPDTIEETKRLLGNSNKSLFVVPISFVSDHIETLFEIDVELKKLVGETDGKRIRRMKMFNDDKQYSELLAELIREQY